MTREGLVACGFLQKDIDFLITRSRIADPGEKLLQETNDGYLIVGDLNLKYALVAYSKEFFHSNSSFGTWFDKHYAKAYLRDRALQSRYAILDGPKARGNESEKYDYDLMIFDRKFHRLYFVQIKHRGATALAYLRDEITEFSNHKPFGKAVAQLRGIQENLGSRKLLDRIKTEFHKAGLRPKLVTQEFLESHAGYLIVHSIENFDFGMKEGVAMYEWNPFRNLIKGEIVRHAGAVTHSARVDIGDSPLDEPRRVADALVVWIDSQRRPTTQPSLSEVLKRKEKFNYNLSTALVRRVFWRLKPTSPFMAMRFPML